MESPAVGCQLSSDNPLSRYFALTTHFDGSVGSGMIDLNAQIRSMASKSSFDKTLLAGTRILYPEPKHNHAAILPLPGRWRFRKGDADSALATGAPEGDLVFFRPPQRPI